MARATSMSMMTTLMAHQRSQRHVLKLLTPLRRCGRSSTRSLFSGVATWSRGQTRTRRQLLECLDNLDSRSNFLHSLWHHTSRQEPTQWTGKRRRQSHARRTGRARRTGAGRQGRGHNSSAGSAVRCLGAHPRHHDHLDGPPAKPAQMPRLPLVTACYHSGLCLLLF